MDKVLLPDDVPFILGPNSLRQTVPIGAAAAIDCTPQDPTGTHLSAVYAQFVRLPRCRVTGWSMNGANAGFTALSTGLYVYSMDIYAPVGTTGANRWKPGLPVTTGACTSGAVIVGASWGDDVVGTFNTPIDVFNAGSYFICIQLHPGFVHWGIIGQDSRSSAVNKAGGTAGSTEIKTSTGQAYNPISLGDLTLKSWTSAGGPSLADWGIQLYIDALPYTGGN